jgi:hypothetical protein
MMSFDLYLSAHPNFYGEVHLRITGGGLEDGLNETALANRTLHIATVERPLLIESETTQVQIGYLIYDVADIKITENTAAFETAVLSVGDRIELEIGSFERKIDRQRNMMQFIPADRRNLVTQPDSNPFRVTDIATVHGVHRLTVARGAGSVGLPAVDNPGIIHLTDLALDIDRTVPEGGYNLLVNIVSGTNAWTSNTLGNSGHLWLYDRFTADGMTLMYEFDTGWTERIEYYVEMVTQGAGRQTVQKVEIWAFDHHAVVDGREQWIGDAPPVLEYGRFFVPIRFISEILGVPEQNIIWDPALRTVTILTTDGRTIQFAEGQEAYWLNNVRISTFDEDAGDVVAPFVHVDYNRFYVPFRVLGNALGIEVYFDHYTNAGVYNTRGFVPASIGLGNGDE